MIDKRQKKNQCANIKFLSSYISKESKRLFKLSLIFYTLTKLIGTLLICLHYGWIMSLDTLY